MQTSTWKYAVMGGGMLCMLLAVWLLSKTFCANNNSGNTPTQPTAVENDGGIPTTKSGLEMVQVPGGTFTMGSPLDEIGRDRDECQHAVTVRAFSIGKYEVTQADWRGIMGANPSDHQNCDECPVENVSWDSIQVFLARLNARYPGKNYRLPTEAEWEYAARGGGGAYLYYSGSNNPSDVGWHAQISGHQTHPVGLKQANQLGLYDMSGNVWEWCQDIYLPYPCDASSDSSGKDRMIRGGSAFNEADYCRVAARHGGPADHGRYLGLRLASDSPQ